MIFLQSTVLIREGYNFEIQKDEVPVVHLKEI